MAAFAGFESDRAAASDRTQIAGLIHDKVNIEAVIETARRIVAMRESHRSFARWLDALFFLTKETGVKLFKRLFLLRVGDSSGRSIAPGAARWPQLICAPSKAGPV